MSRPYVTVLIDTFNHERFIERAVTSVLEQDFPSHEMEILVVDDGSADATPSIVSRFAPHVRLLRKPNGGQASAFNFAIPEARGEVIVFLDGDDWWAPAKLAHVCAAMRQNSQIGLVGHGIIEVRTETRPDALATASDAGASENAQILCRDFRFRADTLEGARLFRLRKCFLGTSRMALRADLAQTLLPIPEALVVEADEYLFTLAAVSSNALILPEALLFYRIHDDNLFHAVNFTPGGLRRKQNVMAVLALELECELRRRGLPREVIWTIVEPLHRDACQLRLLLDGGWPWETAWTEWRLFCIHVEDATMPYRLFKLATLAPALALPPRIYYHARARVARSQSYLRARAKWLPMPVARHMTPVQIHGPSNGIP